MKLKYSTGELDCPEIFDYFNVVAPKNKKIPSNPIEIINKSLDKPVSSQTFDDYLTDKKSALIIISDKTRNTRADLFLPVILEKLKNNGIKPRKIKILFATGIHNEMNRDEMINVVGRNTFKRIHCECHNAFDKNYVVEKDGYHFNPMLFEYDAIIITGTISYHYFAGYGGGRKSILPGVCSADDCTRNHRMFLTEKGQRNPLCYCGNLENNPVHSDMEEALSKIDNAFLINTIVDEKGNLLKCVSGSPTKAFIKGTQYFDNYFRVPIPKKYKVIITSPGGYPKDINLIQLHKTIEMASYSIVDGGFIFLVGECRDGVGNDDFLDWFIYKNEKEFANNLMKNYKIYGQTAYSLFCKARKYNVYLLSALPDYVLNNIRINKLYNLDDVEKILKVNRIKEDEVLVNPFGSTYLLDLEENDKDE